MSKNSIDVISNDYDFMVIMPIVLSILISTEYVDCL